jgi:hypothetical protein
LLSLCCAARDVLAGLLHPAVRLRIADEVEKPPEEGEAVAASESEPCCVGSKGIGKCARVVVNAANGIGHDLRYRVGFLAVVQEI